MKYNYQLSGKWWLAAGLAVAFSLASTGCARLQYGVKHAVRETQVMLGDEDWAYFHAPRTGEIMARRHWFIASPWCEGLPLHGYEETCWRPWPQGCGSCPSDLQQVQPFEAMELLPPDDTVVSPPDHIPLPAPAPADTPRTENAESPPAKKAEPEVFKLFE